MADYSYIKTTGVIVPDTSTQLADVQGEWQDVFGSDLVVTTDTPQGVMITAETLSRADMTQNNAVVANQINPNYAGGLFLDAIMALTGIERNSESPTTVSGVTLTGVAGTIIGVGSQAKTTAGDLFETTAIATIGAGGTVTVDFQSVESGAIPCPIGSLTSIVTGIVGWETVNNTVAGVLGAAQQSDASARAYRKNTLSIQGVSLCEAITAALYATTGVTSLAFRENTDPATQTIDTISMVGHSIYVCVDGGTDTDVAAALLENKSGGCAWNGGTSITLREPTSGQSYTVKFDRPTVIGVLVKITVTGATTDAVTQAVIDYANGDINGLTGFIVGADVSPFEIAGAVMAENPGCYVSNVQLSYSSSVSWVSTPLTININEIASTQSSYVTVILA